MKRFFTIAIALLTQILVSFSQDDPQFTLNMYNQLYYNPGFAGSNNAICASLLHRQQYMGFGEGRPVTSVVNVHTSKELGGINNGFGLTILNDVIGYNKTTGLKLSYAYRTDNIGDGELGVGISFGLMNRGLANTNWITPDQLTGSGATVYSDPIIPSDEAATSFDLGFGAFYKTEDYYVGLSSTHLTQPDVKYPSSTVVPFIKRHFYLTGGYFMPLGDPRFKLNPSVFVATDGAATQLATNLLFEYDKQFYGGIQYRHTDAVSIIAGMSLPKGIGVMIAYDATKRLGSSGSFEAMVRYCFNISGNQSIGRYKSVRQL